VLMQKEWFHGDISKDASEDLLSGQPKGTFLVRTSKTKTETPTPFTISKVNKKGKITHQRITKRQDGKFEISIKTSTKTKDRVSEDDNLVPFLRNLKADLYLERDCPVSRYKALFVQTEKVGYVSTDD